VTWAPDYADAADLADFVRTAADNPYVGTYGTAAARAVDDFCGRQFGQMAAPVAFTYDAYRAAPLTDGTWLLLVDDVQDITAAALTVDGATITAGTSGYRWWERNAVAKGQPYTGVRLADRPTGDVALTARFGWTAVPAAVPAAVWLQVNRWHIRRESPYGTAGSPSEGSEVRLAARLDPDVRALLSGGGLVRGRMPQ
jgi:hypothetical protein